MRLKHVGILETKDGIKHGFLYEKSYPVRKDLRFKCGLTSMFYGGVCWKYFFMPNNKQKVTMLEDTDHRLKKLLGGDNCSTHDPRTHMQGRDFRNRTGERMPPAAVLDMLTKRKRHG